MLYRRLVIEWLVVLVAVSLIVAFATSGSWTRAVDNRLYDVAQRTVASEPDDRILLIEIDDSSLREIGRWPWWRSAHAALLERLAAACPRAIGYDVLFLEPSSDDARLAAAIRDAGVVVLPALVRRDTGAPQDELVLPTPGLASATVGVAEVILDNDGVVRRADTAASINGRTAAQMVALLARQAEPGLVFPKHQPFLLPLAPGNSFRRVPFAHVMKGEVPAALIRDKIVLVGATAAGMGDIYTVPSSAGGLMSGVQIQVNLLNALLSGRVIATTPPNLLIVASMVPTWLAMAGFLRLTPAANLRLSLIMLMIIVALSLAGLIWGAVWFPPGAALLGILLVHILWGWRRLAATGQFMERQAAALQADPGMTATPLVRNMMTDTIAHEANQLQGIIGQLRSLRLFTADVVARLPDATVVADEYERIILSNDAADRLFGGVAQGQSIAIFLDRVCEGALCEGSRISLAGGQTLVMSDAPLAGGGRIVRLADMTELQRVTDEREEVLQFLTHDLRSPHAAILTMLQARRNITPEGGTTASVVERIRVHARHGLSLADDFVQLARARRRPIAPEAIDLCDVAREAVDMVWPRAVERAIRIEDGSGDGEIWVMGDHAMLLRAAVNLLDNAVKFAPEGARVDVAVRREQGVARLSVAGPGPEMPPGRAERPFALYAEGRDVRGQTSIGLGLAFVHATATRHGGAAAYHHEPGYGATFAITLPLADED